MPPKTPGGKPKSPAGAPPWEDELSQRLETTVVQLGVHQEKLVRLASATVALDTDRATLGTQLTVERDQFGDVSSYLRNTLAETTAHVHELQRQLADARAALASTHEAAAQAAAAAEARRLADVGEKQAELDGQAERVRQADAYLAERDQLRADRAALEVELEGEKRQHHKRHMDAERKHASDRELWRKETAQAVQAAREEMAGLADQRLDATTKQTICDNEAMAGELQYQGRHMQGLLARNSALQKEVADLRVSVSISLKNEDELVKKGLALEKTMESLLARLDTVDEQRAAEEQAIADLASQLAESQAEVHSLEQRLDDQASRMAELEDELEGRKQELRQLRAHHGEAAAFLLQCLSETKQTVLVEQGRAALAAAASSARADPSSGVSGGQACHQGSPVCCSSSSLGSGSQAEAQAPVQLAGLSPHQREALLQRLLDRLGVDWQEKEGLVLPSNGGSCCSPRGAGRRGGQPSAGSTLGGSPSAVSSCSSSTSEVLMRQLRSDVRPWGAAGSGGTPGAVPLRKQPSVASAGR